MINAQTCIKYKEKFPLLTESFLNNEEWHKLMRILNDLYVGKRDIKYIPTFVAKCPYELKRRAYNRRFSNSYNMAYNKNYIRNDRFNSLETLKEFHTGNLKDCRDKCLFLFFKDIVMKFHLDMRKPEVETTILEAYHKVIAKYGYEKAFEKIKDEVMEYDFKIERDYDKSKWVHEDNLNKKRTIIKSCIRILDKMQNDIINLKGWKTSKGLSTCSIKEYKDKVSKKKL